MNSIDLSTIGIGVIIEEHEDGIHILQVFENSGASKAGVVAGDIIIAINGQSVIGSSTQEVSSLLTGDDNTKIEVTLRHADGKTSTTTITRKIHITECGICVIVWGYWLYRYVILLRRRCKACQRRAYSIKTAWCNLFILNLQNNGGGYVSTAEEIAGLFPKAKLPTYWKKHMPLIKYVQSIKTKNSQQIHVF